MELPKDEPKYMRYEDMPPPTPEDEARFEAEFQEIMRSIFAQRDEDEKWNGWRMVYTVLAMSPRDSFDLSVETYGP